MPRFVPTGLLDSPTRCVAVKVVPAKAAAFGISDTNIPFVWDGVTYEPYNGFDASAIQSESGTSSGTLQITTIESAVLSQITESDLANGIYDGARVWVYEIDYTNPTNGAMILNQYLLGKATFKDSSKDLELNELAFRLRQTTGRTLTSKCPVAKAWDKQCDPSQTLLGAFSFNRTVSGVVNPNEILFSGDSNPADYYSFGRLVWLTGANANGPDIDIKTHTVVSGTAVIVLKPWHGYPVEVGDTATLIRGCPRLFGFCQSVANASNASGTNIENFQGQNIPTTDGIHVVGRNQ